MLADSQDIRVLAVTTATHFPSAFIGRQPILDSQLAVFGYELLFRRSHSVNAAHVMDGDMASARVVLDSWLEFGLDALVADRRAFINAGRSFLVEGVGFELPKERVVIEILEDVPCDSEVVSAVEALATAGYLLALDDFVFRDELKALLGHATFVKVDVSAFDEAALESQIQALGGYSAALVAERVETLAMFERCRALGFRYFQGFFFARPTIVQKRRVPVERLAALRVLALLADDDTPLDSLVDAVSSDVRLSYQVLRAFNSAFYGMTTRVESLREAIVFLGRNRLRHWVTLMALSGLEGRPPEVLTLALVRAKMCEALGASLPGTSSSVWFTAGLFSSVDLFVEAPLKDVLASLPLSPEIVAAVTNGAGRLGAGLSAVLAFERGDWSRVTCESLAPRDFTAAYHLALGWAREWERSSTLPNSNSLRAGRH
jgi:c-di-GMP phosphodiesterase